MNTGFIHNFSEEDNAECQQDNQDSILCGTHGLLILLYRNLEIDAETGIIYIFNIIILIFGFMINEKI